MKSIKPAWHWALLAAASLALAFALDAIAFPAAFLLGPMIAAIGFGLRGASLRVAQPPFVAAQAIVGCLIARALKPEIVDAIVKDWPAMLLVVATTVLASAFVGWLLVKMKTLPGTTAAWGSSPGAASGMVAMAEEFGADPRLVAFMQYLRVTVVVMTAAAMTHFWFEGSTGHGVAGAPAGGGAAVSTSAATSAAAEGWAGLVALLLGSKAGMTPATMLLNFAATLAIAGFGGWLGRRLRIPSGSVFLPLALGATLQGFGIVTLILPPWLLAAGFAAIGWYVGLRFERETTRYAIRAIPAMMVGIVALIVLCMGSAAMLVWLAGTDPLTAYLATSPGGLDALAIIAVGSHADISFVLALQTVRLFIVILTGPLLAKLISRAA